MGFGSLQLASGSSTIARQSSWTIITLSFPKYFQSRQVKLEKGHYHCVSVASEGRSLPPHIVPQQLAAPKKVYGFM